MTSTHTRLHIVVLLDLLRATKCLENSIVQREQGYHFRLFNPSLSAALYLLFLAKLRCADYSLWLGVAEPDHCW